MKENVKNLWIEALRSGDYKQITGALKTEEGFCCLGVLCDLYAKTQKKKGFQKDNDLDCKYVFPDGQELYAGLLPHNVLTWAGMKSDSGYFITTKNKEKALTRMNDTGKTFKHIAKKIEKYWEQL